MRFENNVLVIIEVQEQGKAPDLRYVTIGSTDNNQLDTEFGLQAIETFRADKNYDQTAIFTVKAVIKFPDHASYLKYLQNQLSQYLESLKNKE